MNTPKTDEIWVEHRGALAEYFEKLLEHSRQLECELAEAQNMINLLRESHDVVTKQFQKVDTELAEMRQQSYKWAYECGENMKLLKETIATATRAIEQRDTLAGSLKECLEDSEELLAERDWWKDEPRCDYQKDYADLFARVEKAKQALAALKGGSHE
jgi:chromosome segregation ATPase